MSNLSSIIEGIITCKWASDYSLHEEHLFCKLNLWREFELLPASVRNDLVNASPNTTLAYDFKKGELIPFYPNKIIELPLSSYKHRRTNFQTPKLGRFYPLGLFNYLSGIFPSDISPARLIAVDEDSDKITIDTNHPLAYYDLTIQINISQIRPKKSDVGGECKDWFNIATSNGPGMQVRYAGKLTDFELNSQRTFSRVDETDDAIFYSQARYTAHIDEMCHTNLLQRYTDLLKPNAKVLDLMSSYQSHLPTHMGLTVIGLGLNSDELKANSLLTDYYVQDLNKDPHLPFKDSSFEYVFCDLSVEYLTMPIEVFKEISRVLTKGGLFCISFSNRYFPPKVIKLWEDLHDFERMGYTIELLSQAGFGSHFKTFSYRNYPRPFDDKYFGQTFVSDPLFVVTVQKEEA